MSRSRRANWADSLRQLLCSCCVEETEAIKTLDLSHSLLNEIPPEVFQCQRTLEDLNLDSNHIAELPRQLFNCDELRELSVSDNEINFIPPAISFLQNLQKFDVSKNAVTTLPDNIRQCTNLTYLDLSINPLERLPEGLVNIIALQELYLTDTYLEFLPANFGKLINLRILELRENNLCTLPKTMSRLVHLTRLDIGFNEFHELPEVVSSLQNLIELWIDGNHIKRLSSSIGQLRKMIHFDASQNNLTCLPRDVGYWTKVQEFYISNNELETLPSSIGNLINLIRLKLEENSLKCLPETIGKLTNIEELMVTRNYLSHLPGSIGLLRKLRILDVDKNYLVDIPAELGSCVSLSILSLRENRLTEIPAEIGHLSSLKVLNLVDNVIKFLPMSILKLKNLSALWLSNNQSQPLMPLQQERDLETNTNVLTCFMLPQQRNPPAEPAPVSDDSSHRPRVAPRHIYFAPNIGASFEHPGRLTRAPTPYPKELRALAKHAKQAQKNLSASQSKSGERAAQQTQSSLEIREATVVVKPGPSSQMLDVASPRSVETLSEPLVSPLAHPRDTEITPTPDSSESSLPLAHESTPVIREAKNIRTDTQTCTVVHGSTPQLIHVAPAPAKKATVPPPYHIAAAYSVKAQFFNPETSGSQLASGDSSDQQNVAMPSTSTSILSSQHSGQTSTRRLYSGRESFSYATRSLKFSESSRTESPIMSFSEHDDSQNTSRNPKLNRVSPTPMTSDESVMPQSSSDLSHFSVKSSLGVRNVCQQTGAVGEVESAQSSGTRSSSVRDTYNQSEPSDYSAKPTLCDSDPSTSDERKGLMLQISDNESDKKTKTESTGPSMQCSSDEIENVIAYSDLSPGEIQQQSSSGSLSPGELRIPRSIRSLDVFLNRPGPSSLSRQRSSLSLGIYPDPDSSEQTTRTESSIHRAQINLDEFVSGTVSSVSNTTSTASGSAVGSFNVDESSGSSEPISHLSFQLLTPPMSQGVNLASPLYPIAEHNGSGSRVSSDPIADSVECDMGSEQNVSNTSSEYSSRRLNLLAQDRSATTVTGDTRSSTQTSGSHGNHSTTNNNDNSLSESHSGQSVQLQRRMNYDAANYPLPESRSTSHSGHSSQAQTLSGHSNQFASSLQPEHLSHCDRTDHTLVDNKNGSVSSHSTHYSQHSDQAPQFSSGQASHGHTGRTVNIDPLNYALPESSRSVSYSIHLSPSQTLSTHSSQSVQSGHSVFSPQISLSHSIHSPQALSSHYVQSPRPSQSHSTSSHSNQSSFPDLSVHSGRSFHTVTPHSVQQAYLAQAQGMVHSPHSSHSPYQSLSLSSGQTPATQTPSYLSLSARSNYFPRSVHMQPAHASTSTPSLSAGQSAYFGHLNVSTESEDVDNSASNLNKTFTRSSHPCAVMDNDNVSAGDHENNFDNKPRFFVQDQPSPGQNIVVPTPKRPSAGDKSSRIPYLTSPTMHRAEYISETSSQMSSLQSFAASPRSARRDLTMREVKSDSSIIASGCGIKKTKIPAPNTSSEPVSPECSRGKKWVFGQHKNATVMNILIQKNPDLGFSITEIPGKGIFVDDVKHQENLSVGDKILEVEGIDTTVLRKEEVMEILLAAGRHICMMISHI